MTRLKYLLVILRSAEVGRQVGFVDLTSTPITTLLNGLQVMNRNDNKLKCMLWCVYSTCPRINAHTHLNLFWCPGI